MDLQEKKQLSGAAAAGGAAGMLSGLLGGSGGMVLVPGLRKLAGVAEDRIFPTTVAVMLPVTASALLMQALSGPLPIREALPCLAGGWIGGWIAGTYGQKVPLRWLHRSFGALILFGGIRTLCS